jgi:hypothetical protein
MKRVSWRPSRQAGAFGAAATLALAGAAAAQQPAAEPQEADLRRQLSEEGARLNDLYRMLDDQQRQLDSSRRLIEEQRQRVDVLMRELTGRGLPPAGSGPQATGAPAAAGSESVAQTGSPADQPKRPVGEAPAPTEGLPQTAQIFSEPTVLTRAGGFTLEPSLQYVYSSDNRVALVGFTIIPAITIGLIDIRRVAREAWYAAFTARYGLTSRFELEAKVPYVYSETSTLTRPLATPSVTDTNFESSGNGLGDIELGGRYQINAFRGDNMVYIGGLRVRLPTGKGPFDVNYDPNTNLQTENPTGTGFYSVQPGISFVYPSDPAVFFGGLAYTYSLSRDVGNGFATIKPGGVTDVSFGMGLALNERASFSFGFQLSYVGETTQSGDPAPGRTLTPSGSQTLGTARFGLTYAFTRRTALNLTVGIGMTNETPGLELTARVPISF